MVLCNKSYYVSEHLQLEMELWKNKLNLVGFEEGGFLFLLEADTAYNSSGENGNNHLIWVNYVGNKEQ